MLGKCEGTESAKIMSKRFDLSDKLEGTIEARAYDARPDSLVKPRLARLLSAPNVCVRQVLAGQDQHIPGKCSAV